MNVVQQNMTSTDLRTIPDLPGVTHRFADLPGLRMHLAEAGLEAVDGEDPPVLLLHGFPQHWWEWRHVIAALAERHRVIAPDLRGAGWTDAPPDGYEPLQQVADVLALLDVLGIERVNLVAHDYSAFTGYRLCYDHPDRVAAFVCLGPHPYVRFDPHLLLGMPKLWFQPVVATPGLGPWALSRDWLPRYLLTAFTARPDVFTDDDITIFTARLHTPGHAGAGSALYRHHILPEVRRLMAGAYRRRRLTVPTVALFGGEEAGVRPGMMDVHGDRADHLTGELVPGASHFIADERPDIVVDRALKLFART